MLTLIELHSRQRRDHPLNLVSIQTIFICPVGHEAEKNTKAAQKTKKDCECQREEDQDNYEENPPAFRIFVIPAIVIFRCEDDPSIDKPDKQEQVENYSCYDFVGHPVGATANDAEVYGDENQKNTEEYVEPNKERDPTTPAIFGCDPEANQNNEDY